MKMLFVVSQSGRYNGNEVVMFVPDNFDRKKVVTICEQDYAIDRPRIEAILPLEDSPSDTILPYAAFHRHNP